MDKKQQRPLAVVTGASDGIGYELAVQFAENGFDLLVCAEDRGIAEAAQAFQGRGVEAFSMQVDLATPDGVEKFYQRIRSLNRPVEAIAINAGIGVNGRFAEDTALQDELKLIDLNVRSSVHLTKLVVKDMAARKAGRVLIVSSIASTMPAPYMAVYAASKSFLQSFSQAIREELKDSGVTVTSLMPGATETNFFHRAGMEDTKVGQAKKDDPADVAKDGFDALMAGKDHVVAGSLKNSVQAGIAKVLPETIQAKIHGAQTKPQ